MRRITVWLAGGLLWLATAAAHADALDTLRTFLRDVKTGRADFTQTVTTADRANTKTSSGEFAFARPERFRFAYTKPYQQLIVSDGSTVWIYDADLEQASARPVAQALGSTPAALLAGGNIDAQFELKALPDRDGLQWVQATPKAEDSGFQSARVGFRGQDLAALEITDSFGQRSLLRFSNWQPNVTLPAERFRFAPPPGTDVIRQ